MKGIGWLLQRIAGLVLVAGLTIHFSIMHYGLAIPYGSAFKFIFLMSVIFHGFYGLWGIVLEYVKPLVFLRICQSFILISAFLLAAAGIYI